MSASSAGGALPVVRGSGGGHRGRGADRSGARRHDQQVDAVSIEVADHGQQTGRLGGVPAQANGSAVDDESARVGQIPPSL